MKRLDDKFLVAPDNTDHAAKADTERKLKVSFEKRARELVGVRVLKDRGLLNPLFDKLQHYDQPSP
jgi:hypothetical protein